MNLEQIGQLNEIAKDVFFDYQKREVSVFNSGWQVNFNLLDNNRLLKEGSSTIDHKSSEGKIPENVLNSAENQAYSALLSAGIISEEKPEIDIAGDLNNREKEELNRYDPEDPESVKNDLKAEII